MDRAERFSGGCQGVIQGIVLKGVGVDALWPEIRALAIFAVVIMGAAALRFRKSLD